MVMQQLRGLAEGVAYSTLEETIRFRGVLPGRVELRPSFMIVGGQRCGTTSLQKYLQSHPDFAAPARKEIHYFDKNYFRGDDWYWAHFPQARPNRFTGDATPYYLFHPLAPQRAAATLPDTKIVLLLRDPVDRARSHHSHAFAKGHETLSLADAIAAEPERLAGERDKLIADPRYLSPHHQHNSYMSRGHYIDQLLAWDALYPREQILILTSEELFSDPQAQLDTLTEFLDVEPFQLGEAKVYNTYKKKATPDALLDSMAATFVEDNQRLFEYLGRELDWRKP